LANLSHWSTERIEQLRAVLRGERLLPAADAVEIVRALPHGHVLAAVTTARRIDLAALLPHRMPQRKRDLAVGLIIARMLDPAAKLATARMLDPRTASHSLGEALGLGGVTAKEIYATLDWGLRAEFHRDHAGAAAPEERCPAALRCPHTRKDAAANSPVMATVATTGATARSWSSACSVPRTAVP
jgi:hypothetical protein